MTKIVVAILILLTACAQVKGGKTTAGPAGPQGVPGKDATPVYAVQLCPNQPHPQYPNHFPEEAICINGSLHGVFNGTVDYFTELPPGNYKSIAPEGCNLVIMDNCQVSQQ